MDECSLVTVKCCLLLRKGHYSFKFTCSIAHYDKGGKRFLFLCHYLHFRGLMGSLRVRVGSGENQNDCPLADLYFFVRVTKKLCLNWDTEKPRYVYFAPLSCERSQNTSLFVCCGRGIPMGSAHTLLSGCVSQGEYRRVDALTNPRSSRPSGTHDSRFFLSLLFLTATSPGISQSARIV